jgi:non-specific serine/threonine protein kinase
MLETVREFGVGQLEACGEGETVRSAHAAFYLDLIEQLWPGWFRGAGFAARLDRVEIERDNLRATLTWADDHGALDVAARMAHALRVFWVFRGPVSEGYGWCERVLAYGPKLSDHLRIELLYDAGYLAFLQGDLAQAVDLEEQALALARTLGAPVLVAGAMYFLGVATLARNREDDARRLFEEALPVFRAIDDEVWTTALLDSLGVVAWRQGDSARAATLFEEALALARTIPLDWATARLLGHLGNAVADLGDDERAAELYRESLVHVREINDRRVFAGILAGLADLLARLGQPERAARLCGAIEALCDSFAMTLFPAGVTSFQRTRAVADAVLTEEALRCAWSEGRVMTMEQAYADALAGISGRDAISNPTSEAGRVDTPDRLGLTRREREVLRLLAEGHSDREIAAALFVSRRTAATHVAHVYQKLGVTSRAAAAAYAVRHGLA